MSFGRNPEFAAMNNIDRESRADNIKETADRLLPLHDRIAPILEKISIDPNTFTDYDPQAIARDLEYASRREKDFAAEENDPAPGIPDLTIGDVRKLAEILEYQMIRGINTGDWMKNIGKAIKTSRFDDIANGVDTVLEIKDPTINGHLGVGVDISFSYRLESKFARIKADIDSFNELEEKYKGDESKLMGQVKYFRSPRSGFTGRLSGLPRVVAALDIGVIEDICRKKDVNGHIAGHAIIREMQEQLGVYREYAGDTGSGAYARIDHAKKLVDAVGTIAGTNNALSDSGYEKNTGSEEAIKRGLKMFT